jgi:catechol 2,3-dioxygenase-like lactoylglutathione lyase family enzyme
MLLDQLNLVVRDMEATLGFYRELGLAIVLAPDGRHASAKLENGLALEFDTTDFAHEWDSGRRGATGGGAVIGFSVGSREEVDRIYSDLTAAGHRAHQPPYDAFWGARYAIVDDPDGRPVGFMSPIEPERKFWPPERPPVATG